MSQIDAAAAEEQAKRQSEMDLASRRAEEACMILSISYHYLLMFHDVCNRSM